MDDADERDPGPIEALICEFLDRLAKDGPSVIDELCARHPERAVALRNAVRELDRLGLLGVFNSGPAGGGPSGDGPDAEARRLGDFLLVRRIGSGGMGVVWEAEQISLGRRVALKLMRPEAELSPTTRERFRREIEAISRLDHPSICTVYEAGEIDGSLYLAMRLLDGETLADRIERRSKECAGDTARRASSVGDRELAETLEIIACVARALHAAHEHGLVHRDVKPANILVERSGNPVLLDFGLARALDHAGSSLTLTGEAVGTPAYMAPEQLRESSSGIDRRTDVYSLGATLYEALTLQRPFSGANRAELYEQILHSDSASVRSLNRRVPRDLEVVVHTALEKDRNRRYATAEEFADDLGRVLCFEPIRARPIGRLLRLRRWAQRHPAAAVTIGALGVLLAVTLGFLWQQGRTLIRTRALALASASVQAADSDQMLALYLARRAVELDKVEETISALHEAFSNATERDRLPHDDEVTSADWSEDGTKIVTASTDGLARIWDFDPSRATPRPRSEPRLVLPHDSEVWWAEFSPRDPNRLLTSSSDGVHVWSLAEDPPSSALWMANDEERRIRAVHSRDGEWIVVQVPPLAIGNAWIGPVGGGPEFELGESTRSGAFLPDGSAIVESRTDRMLHFWDWRSRREVREPLATGLSRACGWIRFSRDGARMVVGLGVQGVYRVFDPDAPGVQSQAVVRGSHSGSADINDEGWVVAGSADHLIRLFDRDGALMGSYRGHTMHAVTAFFSPDGKQIVSASADGTARVWDFSVPKAPVLRGHTGIVWSVAFLPWSEQIVTASEDGSLRLWNGDGSPARTLLQLDDVRPGGGLRQVAVGPQSRSIAVGGPQTCTVLDLQGGERRLESPGGAMSVCFLGPTGSRLAAACGDGKVRVWDVERAEVVREFVVDRGPSRVVSSPDGSKLVVCRNGEQLTPGQRSLARQVAGPALLFDLGSTSDAPVDELGADVWNAAFSAPDGDALLTAESDGMARLWDLRSGSLLREFGPHESQVIAVAFAPPHGDRVLTVSRAQVARIWSATDGKLRATLRGHTGTVWSGAFSADGKRAATASTDHTVRVWIVDEEELIRAASDRQLEVRPEQLVPYADLLDDGR